MSMGLMENVVLLDSTSFRLPLDTGKPQTLLHEPQSGWKEDEIQLMRRRC